uniref:Unplaced genomic scaffold supercont1.26, whole genome shotgun sequence n=1 Tax=Cryptococcus bacillisporus CA1280 TaxID=1296109 RepID=A0A0D0VDC8_CRYGA|nr:hypothetical protein I312_06269 [Cryptococcus bacillisporus CA1280]
MGHRCARCPHHASDCLDHDLYRKHKNFQRYYASLPW